MALHAIGWEVHFAFALHVVALSAAMHLLPLPALAEWGHLRHQYYCLLFAPLLPQLLIGAVLFCTFAVFA